MKPTMVRDCTGVFGESQGFIGLPGRIEPVEDERGVHPAFTCRFALDPEDIAILVAGGEIELTLHYVMNPPPMQISAVVKELN